jgi:hypothetical protein
MSVVWGIDLFIRVAVAEINPATLVFLRTTLAAAILLPIALVRVDVGRRSGAALAGSVRGDRDRAAMGPARVAEQHLDSLTGLLIAARRSWHPRCPRHRRHGPAGAHRPARPADRHRRRGRHRRADFQASDATALVRVFVVAVCYAVGQRSSPGGWAGCRPRGHGDLARGLRRALRSRRSSGQRPRRPPTRSLGVVRTRVHGGRVPRVRGARRGIGPCGRR